MTEPTHCMSVSLRKTRGAPESWLVGALLILFGVAIAAAMPQISGAVRGAMADAAKNAQGGDATPRESVRVRLLSVRLIEPKAPSGLDDLVVADAAAYVPANSTLRFAPSVDLARQIRARGINTRAPPSASA